MLNAPCPHCGKVIELAGAGELDAEFGINQNQLQYLREHRERSGFPAAWLEFGNRHLYLGAELREFFENRQQKEVEQKGQELMDLSPEARRRLRDFLDASLDGGTPPEAPKARQRRQKVK